VIVIFGVLKQFTKKRILLSDHGNSNNGSFQLSDSINVLYPQIRIENADTLVARGQVL